MGLKKRMKSIVEQVVADLHLDYRVQKIFEPKHSAGIWGISFFDRGAPAGEHLFQIGVGPVDERTLMVVKAELLAKLSTRPPAVPRLEHETAALDAQRMP